MPWTGWATASLKFKEVSMMELERMSAKNARRKWQLQP
ncbi:hypothetical protein X805_38990 [Sphaerotilus natans subsp. natans DSM 6575]|uniref:Uncharacterized protein n=1 Tax=Sphaerotilus natans subsp. natans DSM 6575 TaxID=1286631 RepID=A0A059KGQ6_9BURK|nr:hypothetical protein X805_38990 [Sphaerotilus natans subsp. natans DSM 6575]